MQEKKLTDEEIVKALECCTKSRCDDETTGDCPLKNDESCSTILAINALELIRRLQYGYSSASKASEEWREKYEKERKENAELQKQVDELKSKQVIECHGMLKGCDMVQQAVKDEAKETYSWLKEHTFGGAGWELVKTYFRGKGVEVE